MPRFNLALGTVGSAINEENNNYTSTTDVVLPQCNNEQVSIEELIHLFCAQKNLSAKTEEILFNLLRMPQFTTGFKIRSFSDFKKTLDLKIGTISHTIVYCAIKHSLQKNYKPQDPSKITKFVSVPIYSVRDHLQRYLEDSFLSSNIITSSEYDGNTFSTFTTGKFFDDLCKALPPNVLPICCKDTKW